MSRKLKVALLFGGRSAEHEVSLRSARNVYQALDKSKYDPILIGIDRDGAWCIRDEAALLLESADGALPNLEPDQTPITLVPEQRHGAIVPIGGVGAAEPVDVVFPILHGTYGEDGTMQGLLRLANVAFVGPDVLGSAVGMDKDVMKRLFIQANIPTAPYRIVRDSDKGSLDFESLSKELGSVLFVKPANTGSSVGVHRVTNAKELQTAVTDALQFDRKVLIERGIVGRELECAVLGNDEPEASCVGEVLPHAKHGFYSYDAKYIDSEGAKIVIPADIPASVEQKVRAIAIKAFTTLCLEGMARVDVFATEDGDVLLNEVNTIPGFTSISMYPKLWEQSGLPYSQLIDRLIELALERHKRMQGVRTVK